MVFEEILPPRYAITLSRTSVRPSELRRILMAFIAYENIYSGVALRSTRNFTSSHVFLNYKSDEW